MTSNEILEIMKEFNKSDMTKMTFAKGELSFKLEKAHKSLNGNQKRLIFKEEVDAVDTEEASEITKEQMGHQVVAPIVGVFYDSPSPDKASFVKVGDTVKKGQVLCIIEAMKVMNEVVSDIDGVIESIKGVDGELVEYGQVLYTMV